MLTYIAHVQTINTLNLHATNIACSFKTTTPKFHELFAKFITVLEESGFDNSYLNGQETTLTNAYWSFHNCIRSEVKLIKPSNEKNNPSKVSSIIPLTLYAFSLPFHLLMKFSSSTTARTRIIGPRAKRLE